MAGLVSSNCLSKSGTGVASNSQLRSSTGMAISANLPTAASVLARMIFTFTVDRLEFAACTELIRAARSTRECPSGSSIKSKSSSSSRQRRSTPVDARYSIASCRRDSSDAANISTISLRAGCSCFSSSISVSNCPVEHAKRLHYRTHSPVFIVHLLRVYTHVAEAVCTV